MEASTGIGGSTSVNTTASIASTALSHDDYQPMIAAILDNFENAVGPLFTTNIEGRDLWDVWLDDMPAHKQQHHNCHACRRFIERYGGLVTIDEDGKTKSAIVPHAFRRYHWQGGATGGIYADSFRSLANEVERARVTGVFLSSEAVWGTPSTTDKKRGCTWHHMHVMPPASMRYRGTVLTADQRMAELAEDYATLCRALAEFKSETVTQALAIAQADALYRGEKVEGRLKWLAELQVKRAELRGPARDNVTWRAVATAPAGFCHVKSSVVGSLLEDIEAGKSFAEVKRAFDDKMHPLRYQRPQAAPSAGNIKQAEAIVAKLGSAGALRRRFARLEDLKTIWTPAPTKAPPSGRGAVFGHLLDAPKLAGKMIATAPAMTWEKFARTVLPNAERMEMLVPVHGNYTAFVTAADPDAPPILQWDRDGARNPVSWYTYTSGSPARQWNITASYVEVTAVSSMPNMWQEGFKHHGDGVLIVLKDCRDTRAANLCLFPELLKSEYHAVRATIEAFSRGMELEGADQASACGLTIRSGGNGRTSTRLRVYSRGTVTDYTIDRWD